MKQSVEIAAQVWKLPTTIGCAASNERFTLGYAVEAAA